MCSADENALGASDVAKPMHVFVLDHFVDMPISAIFHDRFSSARDDLSRSHVGREGSSECTRLAVDVFIDAVVQVALDSLSQCS